MNWLERDPYRIRLSWTDRVLIATPTLVWLILVVGRRVLAEHHYDKSLVWLAGACIGTFAIGACVYAWRRKRLRRQIEPLGYRACPRCHYPLVPSGTTSVRCTECGFLGDETMVVESWSQLFRRG